MIYKIEHEIRTDFDGFAELTCLLDQIESINDGAIEIDMSGATWFDANMCAPFGAIIQRVSQIAPVTLTKISTAPKNVHAILAKNNFLSAYGGGIRKHDAYQTTIAYTEFELHDEKTFAVYIRNGFVGKGIPSMSEALKRKVMESVDEVFGNAAFHSETQLGIFTCGQYFPKKNHLDFAIVDLGIGIPNKIKKELGLEKSATDAIIWATEGANTTRKGPIPGGSGLKLLKEFITLNSGCIRIVSQEGYVEIQSDGVTKQRLDYPFPGTAVCIQINTSDTKSYKLSSEVDVNNIF